MLVQTVVDIADSAKRTEFCVSTWNAVVEKEMLVHAKITYLKLASYRQSPTLQVALDAPAVVP